VIWPPKSRELRESKNGRAGFALICWMELPFFICEIFQDKGIYLSHVASNVMEIAEIARIDHWESILCSHLLDGAAILLM